ncbi:MAG: hypothetical protein H0U57_03345 [Tatlockia sp.]|nr:hypothetical protein [Tatlockia sp.]
MSKEQSESFKKKMEELRETVEMEDKAAKNLIKQRNMTTVSSERALQLDGEKDSNQIYVDWLEKYKAKNPDFKEDENTFAVDDKKVGWIKFTDPEAEEDFVRHFAANCLSGKIVDKGITIAKFKNGKLIDPRTNEEFPKGGYANLVQKLDSGIDYKEIPSPKSSSPTPFATNPF